MNKKHFIRAAEIVNAIRQDLWTSEPPHWADRHAENYSALGAYGRAVQTAEAFIVLATEFNPRFDTNRFLIACGLVDAPAKPKRTRKVA